MPENSNIFDKFESHSWDPYNFFSNPRLLWQIPMIPLSFLSATFSISKPEKKERFYYKNQNYSKFDAIVEFLAMFSIRISTAILALPLIALALITGIVAALALVASYVLNSIWAVLLVPAMPIIKNITNIITLPSNLIFYALTAATFLATVSLIVASMLPAVLIAMVISTTILLPYHILRGIFYELPIRLFWSANNLWKSFWRAHYNPNENLADNLNILLPFFQRQEKKYALARALAVTPTELKKHPDLNKRFLPPEILQYIFGFMALNETDSYKYELLHKISSTPSHRKVNFSPASCIPSHTRRKWHKTKLLEYQTARHRLLNPPQPENSTPSATSSSTAGRQRRTG